MSLCKGNFLTMKTGTYFFLIALLSTSLFAHPECEDEEEEQNAKIAEHYREAREPYQFPHSSFRDDEQMEMDEDASWPSRQEDSFLESLRR
jgi:hypothetical protein